MTLTCPRCGRILAAHEINVAKDLAVCTGCSNAFSLSEVLHGHGRAVASLDPSAAPSGAWFRESPDGFEAGATTRSALAFFLVPFMLVWSGGSLGAIYGGQIAKGEFSIGLSLFGLPFLAGSVLFWTVTAMAVAGQCRARVSGDDASLFTGVGPFGRTQRFRWSEIQSVSEAPSGRRAPGGLYLDGIRRLSFGSQLSPERRYFMLQVLRSRVNRTDLGQPPYRTTA